MQNGDLLLVDMGAEFHCYASDITCTYPVNGRFTRDQKIIYNAVLRAHDSVIASAKPGICWSDMHRLADRIICEELLKYGILHNGTVEEMMAAFVPSIFMPHGLGHLMGLDVHDVGGYPKGLQRSSDPGLCRLRTARTLEVGMVLTVEPGCYFIDALLDGALRSDTQSRYINAATIERFRGFGGVRIESNVVVTMDGVENLTKVPRTIKDIEKIMS